jgi:UDP-N-acetylmuramate--alanine ligase
MLGQLTTGSVCLAVAGTHGKTTTTAMISWMLTALGQDPSYLIGGVSMDLNSNAHAGKGSYFVLEADEYDHMFLGLQPKFAVITNIEFDHPDCFRSEQDFYQAFVDFVKKIPPAGLLLTCTDDRLAGELFGYASQNLNIRTRAYGFEQLADGSSPDYTAKNLVINNRGGYEFGVYQKSKFLADISLSVPGLHNVRNALASLAIAHLLELPLEIAAESISGFQGTERRFEIRAEVSGITVVDDYAHHPTEIQATLQAARNRFPHREIWAVWQPHTYTRTEALFDRYIESFHEADHVLVTEIFASREKVRVDYSAKKLVQTMSHPDASFISSKKDTADYLVDHLNTGDVLLVLSAGDANQISEMVLEKLSLDGANE